MDDETITQIALSYSLLKESLRELQEVRKDKHGAVLDYVTRYYIQAQKSVEFLKSKIPDEIRTRLNLTSLEEQLFEFGNTHISL